MKLLNQLSLFLIILMPLGAWSQELDSLEVEGKTFYVYPFNADTESSYNYWNARAQYKSKSQKYTYKRYLAEVEFDGTIPDSMLFTKKEFKNFKKLRKTRSYEKLLELYIPKFGEIPTEEEFNQYLEYRADKVYKKQNNKESKRYKYLSSKKFVKTMRENPWPMLIQSYGEDKDIIPVLDPIPDGNYIQLYDGYCLVDSKGNCIWIEDNIAGSFSIKNNTLDGEATWFGLQGDTLKHGWFKDGLKQGVWEFTKHKIGYLSEEEVELYIKTGSPTIDTSYQTIEYKNGVKNGKYTFSESTLPPSIEGHYTENEESGEWLYRNILDTYDYAPTADRGGDPNLVMYHFTFNDDDSLIVKPILVRDGIIRTWGHDPLEYDFLSEFELLDTPSDLYSVAFEREIDLDLEEEKGDIRDYEDEYYGEEEYGFGYEDNDFHSEQAVVFDDNELKKRGIVIDSIGAYPRYINTLERFYPNGQLIYKYEFTNGLLNEEPNIYWDNGTIHDEVIFVADSNHYMRNIYDYEGKLYQVMIYDLLGDFVRIVQEPQNVKYILLDGLEVEDLPYGNTWNYSIEDSIYDDPMTETVLSGRSWSKIDSSVIWEGYYDPIQRVRSIKSFAADGSLMFDFSAQFSENFESWTGKSHDYFGSLELETIKSASFFEWSEVDSIPQNHVNRIFNLFDIANDYTLKQNGELYSGVLKIDLTKKQLGLKKSLIVELPAYTAELDKLEEHFRKYKATGKAKYPLELSRVHSSSVGTGSAKGTFSAIFYPLLGKFFDYNIPYDPSYWGEIEEYGDSKRIKKKDKPSQVEIIEGAMLDGKPNGTWTSYDQFGNVLLTVPFENGVPNGRAMYYDYASPIEEFDYYYGENDFQDTFPEKRTHYLIKVEDYVNGKMDGKEILYDWVGAITYEADYKDGYKHGRSIERNALATSISQYQDGALDGYVKTYLTLPGQDSLLLYDLLFQNGMLQGESKSYHTNGNISKRGFFLTGDPIDDYEGFDSLGFRYHYVKFNYSFPVEEKIWEENELSVRYKFNWEDSIQFNPIDITNSESLDVLLMEHGLGGGYLEEPYFGRPSIVEKGGIDYHLTKYYPNDTVARDGKISHGRKSGHWEYFSYEGEKLHEVDYFDSIIVLNDSIKYNSKGIYTEVDSEGTVLYKSYIIEKFERYDCSHSDHYETRQLKTIWEANDSLNRMNGDVINYYDNGTIQSSGKMKNGLPDGEWRFYDPNGKLNKYGLYVLGKRNGRWLSGDLSKTKYLGEICLNPNMPDLEEEIKYRENMLDIEIIYYKLGKSMYTEVYDVNMNFRDGFFNNEETD